MPSKAELMASGLAAAPASKLGCDPMTAFTAAGSSQATATTLTANFSNVTTSAISAGVIIGLPFEENYVYNAGPNTLSIYPPVGGTFLGLALNAALTVAPLNSAWIEGDGINFQAQVGQV